MSWSTCCAASASRCGACGRRSILKAELTLRTANATTSMSTVIMTTTTDAALYRLMTWLSPAYPLGAFSYSHGLEYAVEIGLVRDLPTLTDWISTVLEHGAGRVDGALFAAAWRAA